MKDKSQLPNERQRVQLCEMLHLAIVQMRTLSREGKSEQVADLADAFHNLPREISGAGR